MLSIILSAMVLVALTVGIHAVGTTSWIRFLRPRYESRDGQYRGGNAYLAVVWTAVILMLLHLIEVLVWTFAYLVLVPANHLDSVEQALYFSVVTYTTLGYGDVTLTTSDWRVLSGIEALSGTLVIGWSTALLFAVIQRSWRHLGSGSSAS